MRIDRRRASGIVKKVGLVILNQPICRCTRDPSIAVIPETSGLVRDNQPYLVTTGASSLSRGCAVLLFVAALISTASAAPPPSPSPAAANRNAGLQTYDSFRLVHTRNVFDPDRRPVRAPGATASSTATTRADYIALTGIAVDGDKSLAFFSGSRPEFNMVVPANSKVAGATVTKVNPMNIEVERNGRKLVVNVGQTVPLDDKSNPAAAPFDQPTATTPAAPTAGSAVNATTTTTTRTAAPPTAGSAPGAPAAPGNIEEIRRRMMERHNQDQK